MKIKPVPSKLYLKIEEPKAGGLDLSSRPTSIEVAEVLEDNKSAGYKKGDKVMVKSWAIDIISYENKNYYFVDIDSKGICAIIS